MILTAKQHKWLNQIASASRAKSSMYAGLRADLVPDKMLRFFQGAGYVDVVVPHNLAHKDRIVITHLGLEALSARSASEPPSSGEAVTPNPPEVS